VEVAAVAVAVAVAAARVAFRLTLGREDVEVTERGAIIADVWREENGEEGRGGKKKEEGRKGREACQNRRTMKCVLRTGSK